MTKNEGDFFWNIIPEVLCSSFDVHLEMKFFNEKISV